MTEADFIFSARNDRHQAGEADEMFDELLSRSGLTAARAGNENIEIADGLASATQRSGGRDFFDAGKRQQMLDQFFGPPFGGVKHESAGDPVIILDRLQQLLLV